MRVRARLLARVPQQISETAHRSLPQKRFVLDQTTFSLGTVLDFWLGWGSQGMSGHYDQIKHDVAFRKEVVNRVGVGFDIPASLGLIEPNAPKIEVAVEEEVAVIA